MLRTTVMKELMESICEKEFDWITRFINTLYNQLVHNKQYSAIADFSEFTVHRYTCTRILSLH
jgi:hypothetical protein